MSYNQPATHANAQTGISGNLVASVLIVTALIIGGALYATTLPPPPAPAEGLSVAWVQTQASIPLPTSTPLPTGIPTIAPKPRRFSPDPQRVSAGERIFQSVCSTCHGLSAGGVSGLGPSMIDNVFINGLSNDEMLAFVINGRPSDHPDNTTGITMPARGGNSTLSDNDLLNVINYVRSLNPDAVVYASRPADGSAPTQPETVTVSATPTVFMTVEAIEFKPIDLSALGGASSATAAPTP